MGSGCCRRGSGQGPMHQQGQRNLLSHGPLEDRGNSEASSRMDSPGKDWGRWVSTLWGVFTVSYHFANITFDITHEETEGEKLLKALAKSPMGHVEGGFEPKGTGASPTLLFPPHHYLPNTNHGQAVIPALLPYQTWRVNKHSLIFFFFKSTLFI